MGVQVDSNAVLAVVHELVSLLKIHVQLAVNSVGGTVGDVTTAVVKIVPEILIVCKKKIGKDRCWLTLLNHV